ncbi:hypothetical protein EDB89DRAFT_2078380 [Lactarius sanguifluus]|nr:hypothetical protein EDB89DRAFT_2078380 [Lactarius sanguifluus]
MPLLAGLHVHGFGISPALYPSSPHDGLLHSFCSIAVASASYVSTHSAQVPTFPAAPLASPSSACPSQLATRRQHICNSTTENQQPLCRTALANGINNFGVFAPPTANSTISDTEGEEVIYMHSIKSNNVFEVWDSDAMDIHGVYILNGQTLSYSRPAAEP